MKDIFYPKCAIKVCWKPNEGLHLGFMGTSPNIFLICYQDFIWKLVKSSKFQISQLYLYFYDNRVNLNTRSMLLWFNFSSYRKQKQKTPDSPCFFANDEQNHFLPGGPGFICPGTRSVGEIGIHVIMNGQIKQRRRGVAFHLHGEFLTSWPDCGDGS